MKSRHENERYGLSLTRILEVPFVYRAWQGPFAAKKMAPIARHNDLSRPGRVLDIGCGPGTNARYFAGADYVGVDFNPEYIRSAQARHPGMKFVAADATAYQPDQPFDFVLLNSLLHHLDDDQVAAVLSTARAKLAYGGHVHVIELLTSPRLIPGTLARMDRGRFPRTLEKWAQMFSQCFSEVIMEPFTVGLWGIEMWELLYFKGKGKNG
jgi:SAM-dependent methyltransferase